MSGAPGSTRFGSSWGTTTRVVRSRRAGRSGAARRTERVAAELSLKAPARSGDRTVVDALESWIEVNHHVWAPSTGRDHLSRAKAVANDPIGRLPLARIGVDDIEKWHARMRRAGVGEASVRNRHMVLRAALNQAEAWSWLTTNPARLARLRMRQKEPRGVMSVEEVAAVLEAALSIDLRAGLASRGEDGLYRVKMMPEYGAVSPLWPTGTETDELVGPPLLHKLQAWQAKFDENFDWDFGWSSESARRSGPRRHPPPDTRGHVVAVVG